MLGDRLRTAISLPREPTRAPDEKYDANLADQKQSEVRNQMLWVGIVFYFLALIDAAPDRTR